MGMKPYTKLVWSDEFDRPGRPDPAKWRAETGFIRNEEEQYYTDRPENLRVEDGCLVIEARREIHPNARHRAEATDWRESRALASVTSASLVSAAPHRWNRGRIEVRAKIPQALGTWPAIWMIGHADPHEPWPDCGEIDIMEAVGHSPDHVFSTIHTGRYNHRCKTEKQKALALPGLADDFHVYRLDWSPSVLQFFVDDRPLFEYEKESDDPAVWPYDRPHDLRLNLAIGGSWGGQKGIDTGAFPHRMLVDYVRIFCPT